MAMEFVRTLIRITPVNRHSRGKSCAFVPKEISTGIAAFLDLSKSNWKANELHDYETCHCDQGRAGESQAGCNK